MSSFERGGVVQYESGGTRRWLFAAAALGVIVASVLLLLAEPWLVHRRIVRALDRQDSGALRALVAPGLPLDEVGRAFARLREGPGGGFEARYASPFQFLIVAKDDTHPLTLVFGRHGLSWWLVDLRTSAVSRRAPGDSPGGGTVPSPPAPGDGTPAPAPGPAATGEAGLPAIGEYVYVEELPETLDRVAPVYPEEARLAGVEGTVLVMALVGRDGNVKDTRVTRGVPMLDDAALEAVRRWRFKPARARGEPVAVWVAVPVRFTLR